jgi:hypothetical protein
MIKMITRHITITIGLQYDTIPPIMGHNDMIIVIEHALNIIQAA